MRPIAIAILAVVFSGWKAPAAEGLSPQDLMFIQRAAANGRLQLRAAGLALQRADRQVVKNLAQTLVSDYNRINQELTALADRNDAVLPPDDPSDIEGLPIMQTKGSEFDKAYAVFVVGVCDLSVALYETEASKGMNVQVKTWATETLHALRLHAASAKGLQIPQAPVPLVK
jgi:putative membrane protein